jgi:hypothetical protein
LVMMQCGENKDDSPALNSVLADVAACIVNRHICLLKQPARCQEATPNPEQVTNHVHCTKCKPHSAHCTIETCTQSCTTNQTTAESAAACKK